MAKKNQKCSQNSFTTGETQMDRALVVAVETIIMRVNKIVEETAGSILSRKRNYKSYLILRILYIVSKQHAMLNLWIAPLYDVLIDCGNKIFRKSFNGWKNWTRK